ncbi:AAA family ATPase [Cloacibacillus porcorum]|uniref:AAA family ATPase n=1 Tax=Cloacibacillus porcorum TaxID=1197717 RepID=UPI003F0035C8
MRLKIENIAKVASADIKLNGITVIAGENNTGKSTVGKVLFSLLNCFYNIDHSIIEERVNEIYQKIKMFRMLNNILSKNNYLYSYSAELISKRAIRDFIISYLPRENISFDNVRIFLESIIKNYVNDINFEQTAYVSFIKEIKNILSIDDDAVKKIIVDRQFSSEFNSQINNLNDIQSIGKISLDTDIKEKSNKISFETNKCVEASSDFVSETEAIYIDNPFVLDNLKFFSVSEDENEYYHHLDILRCKLSADNKNSVVSEAINREKLSKVQNVISSVVSGDFIRSKDGFDNFDFIEKGTNRPLNLSNLSTGLKTFVIIKRLIENDSITTGTVLILDEPEIHLHPEWQLIFAELLVLLQKQFDLTLLINTHSPYFLSAVEVYAKRHEVEDRCSYYLAQLRDGGAVFEDVTINTEKIYKKLALPFQKLENLRYEA